MATELLGRNRLKWSTRIGSRGHKDGKNDLDEVRDSPKKRDVNGNGDGREVHGDGQARMTITAMGHTNEFQEARGSSN